jgi:hypothetical protein
MEQRSESHEQKTPTPHRPQRRPALPRCHRPMEVREHSRIREKHLQQPYYFTRWYRCIHRDCRTKLVMDEQFKVTNEQFKAIWDI